MTDGLQTDDYPIGVGIIGEGAAGTLHGRIIEELVDFTIIGSYDPAFETDYQLASQLLDDEDNKLICVTSPSETHARYVTAAAERGQSIFVEAPLASNVVDAFRAMSVVVDSGVPCVVGHQRRLEPEMIGALVSGDLPQTLVLNSRDDIPVSGDRFFEKAVHDFDTARWIMGEVQAVMATETDVSAHVWLAHVNGGTSALNLQETSALGVDHRAEVLYDSGRLATFGYSTFDSWADYYADAFHGEWLAMRIRHWHLTPDSWSPQAQAASVVDGFEAVVLAEAARRSAESGRWVSVHEVRQDAVIGATQAQLTLVD